MDQRETAAVVTDTINDPSESRRQCRAIAADGERCSQWLNLSTEGFCLFHDPARAEEAAAARARGQVNSARASSERAAERREKTIEAMDPPPPLELTLAGVAKQLGWLAQQVSAGRLPPKVGSSVTYSLSNLRQALVASDLEAELKSARAELEKLKAIHRRRGA
ncbi:MAG TPA: hypothetical protein VGQ73_05025, partial [Gemmatimonadales bacterium]|nr:hypothetical protein [Gemmatimonadales bacterium]